jgi:peptidyl-dipeptidase Dcp
MAGTPQRGAGLLDEVWPRALAAVAQERARTARGDAARRRCRRQASKPGTGATGPRRCARQRYALDDAEIKPYFALPAMVNAAFDCASRLFGLQFVPRDDLPVYHPDVKAYEVSDTPTADRGRVPAGQLRAAQQAQRRLDEQPALQSRNGRRGAAELPVILNNNNFAKGSPKGEPTLLSLDDARTLFHEFGHGLHGLLSDVTFERAVGHPGAARLRRAAVADLRALDHRTRGAASATPGTGRPARPSPTI